MRRRWLAFAIASALAPLARPSIAQPRVVREQRVLPPFDRIVMRTIGELTVTQGPNEHFWVEAEPKVVARLRAIVNAGTLTIEIEGRVRTEAPVRFHATVRSLRALTTEGSGNTQIVKLRGESLDLVVGGSGSLAARSIDIKRLTVRADGSGDIKLAGNVDEQRIELSGSGDYEASQLASHSARVVVAGAGSAALNVTADLDAVITGSGDITYAGRPRIRKRVEGAGSIEPR